MANNLAECPEKIKHLVGALNKKNTMARKKIKGTKEKLIRLTEETICNLKIKAAKADQPVKLYIENVITKHANK